MIGDWSRIERRTPICSAPLALQDAFRIGVALRRRLAQPADALFVVARHAGTFEIGHADLELRPGVAELGGGAVVLESGVAPAELLEGPAAVRKRVGCAGVYLDDPRGGGAHDLVDWNDLC